MTQNCITFVDYLKKGPDWKDDYNVLKVAIYLNQDDESKTGLNIIKKSHNKKGYLCQLINL